MRVLHWLLVCLCGALVFVSPLRAVTKYGNLHVVNNGVDANYWRQHLIERVQSGVFTGNINSPQGSGTLNAGAETTHGPFNCSVYQEGDYFKYRVQWFTDSGAGTLVREEFNQISWSSGSSTTFESTYMDPAAPTNGYSWISIAWTNTGIKYADFVYGIQDSNGVFHVLSGDEPTLVSPGGYYNRYVTNWGFGGEWVWGDGREDSGMSNPESSGWGSWVGVNHGNSGGSGGNVVVSDPYPWDLEGGGGTNGVSSGEFNTGVSRLMQSLANLENAIRGLGGLGGGEGWSDAGIIQAVNENTTSTHGDLLNIGNYNMTNGAHLAEIMERIGEGTNGLAGALGDISDRIGDGTNGLAGLIGTGTNGLAGLIGTGTNGLSGKLDGLFRGFDTNLVGAFQSNAAGFTNGSLSGSWSNSIADWIPEVSGLKSRADGATDGATAYGGFLGVNGQFAPGDWGVLRGVGYGGVTIFELDTKKAISLEFIEDKISGFRAWVRIIVMWSALFCAVMWYLRELREAVWHTLTPVPLNSPTEALQLVGGLALGPVGFGAGTAAGYLMKTASIVAILLGLLWLPAILAVSLGTIFSALGVDVVGDLTNAVSAPQVVQHVFHTALPWLPAVELCIIAMNYAVARLGMDGTVSILMVYIKVGTPE